MNLFPKHSRDRLNRKKKEYYDYVFTRNILKHSEADPFTVISHLEEYLKIYQKDYNGYVLLASHLISIGKFEEAKKILDWVSEKLDDKKISRTQDKIDMIYKNLKFSKLRLLFTDKNNYQEIIQYVKDNKSLLDPENDNDLDRLAYYCDVRINPYKYNRSNEELYLNRQIVEYEEDDFLRHMKKHLNINNNIEKSPALFSETFNFEEVYEEIKKYIDYCFFFYRGFVEKTCYFKYTGCGTNDGKTVNFFKVVLFREDNNFITMYPTPIGENLRYIDLDYLNRNLNKDVMKLSRVEKFNQKYENMK